MISVGKMICDKCGADCTPPNGLYGFLMQKRLTLSKPQFQAFQEIEKEFGKAEFVFCWRCTALAFGAKPIEGQNPPNPEKVEPHKSKEQIKGQ
jgi:hypothetical protein